MTNSHNLVFGWTQSSGASDIGRATYENNDKR